MSIRVHEPNASGQCASLAISSLAGFETRGGENGVIGMSPVAGLIVNL